MASSDGQEGAAEKKDFVLAKCKRGSDKATEGQSCSSTSAYRTTPPGGSFVGFRCAKCSYAWTIATGGAYNY